MTFCRTIRPTAQPRNMATATPPFLSSSKLAEKPMVVKNAISRKLRISSLNWKVKAPVWCPTRAIREKISPPMMGLGMK